MREHVVPETIPHSLREAPRWVLWRMEDVKGKATKVPYQRDRATKASATDASTWTTFEEAVRAAAAGPGFGLGFVLGDGFVGVDLDKCLSDHDGLLPWARAIVERLSSYTEVSPSQTGVHIICRATPALSAIRVGPIEVYPTARYFTVTGNVWPGYGGEVEERSAQVADLHGDLHRAREFLRSEQGRGMDGAWNGTEPDDASRGDYGLACRLLLWTGGNVEEADRLFRLSRRYREKWDERRGSQTYGALTLRTALDAVAPHLPTGENERPVPPAFKYSVVKQDPPPPDRWLVSSFLLRGAINLISGTARSGKSYVAIGTAVGIASGTPVFRNPSLVVPEPMNVLYVYGEQSFSFWFRRIAASEARYGVTLGDNGKDVYWISNADVRLSEPGGIDRLAYLIHEHGIGVVILDPISALFAVRDQNSAGDVAMDVRRPLAELKRQCPDVTIIAVHHSAKAVRQEFRMDAVSYVRGSEEFSALVEGSIIGTWADAEGQHIRVVVDTRTGAGMLPFALSFGAEASAGQADTEVLLDASVVPSGAVLYDPSVAIGPGSVGIQRRNETLEKIQRAIEEAPAEPESVRAFAARAGVGFKTVYRYLESGRLEWDADGRFILTDWDGIKEEEEMDL